MKLPLLHYEKVVKTLGKAGFTIVGTKGSHLSLKKDKCSPKDPHRIVIVPMHKEIARGTLLHILNASGLTREEFLSLL